MSEDAEKRLNLGLMAHVDAGKTTLTEQLLFCCGAIRKPGRVDEGTTQTDSMPVERERGISVRASVTSLQWKDCFINLIDTPGHMDFAGEVDRVFEALDGVILVVSAVEGIQSHTARLLHALKRAGLPFLVFVNKIDRAGSRFEAIVKELNRDFGGGFLPVNRPLRQGGRDCAATPLASGDELIEGLADFDDAIAEDFLEGHPIPQERTEERMRSLTAAGQIRPVLCGAALQGIGVEALLDAAARWLPRASAKACGELSGVVFKLEHDRTMGKIAHVRLFGGSIRKRDLLFGNDKVSQIRKWSGARYTDAEELRAGDIASLCGLASVRCGDAIGGYTPTGAGGLAVPYLSVAVRPADAARLPALAAAARELSEEDPLLDASWENTGGEVLLNVTGAVQTEILGRLFLERYGLQTEFSPPSVVYRETPSRSGCGFEAYTMPKPCWAVVKLLLEPLPRGSGVEWRDGDVPNDRLYYRYRTQIRTSFFRTLEQGLYGWQVTDLRATLVDGEHHTVHTHPLDFFVATPMAVMNGLQNTGTTLLEPLLSVRIRAGEECYGKITGDIIHMRGEFDAPVLRDGTFTLEALLPAATSLDYPVRFASLTGGRGMYVPAFYRYRECPQGQGETAKRRGVNPLDRANWILFARGALQGE